MRIPCRRCTPCDFLVVIAVIYCHIVSPLRRDVCHAFPERIGVIRYTEQTVLVGITVVIYIVLGVQASPHTCIFVITCSYVLAGCFILIRRSSILIIAVTHHVVIHNRRIIELSIVENQCRIMSETRYGIMVITSRTAAVFDCTLGVCPCKTIRNQNTWRQRDIRSVNIRCMRRTIMWRIKFRIVRYDTRCRFWCSHYTVSFATGIILKLGYQVIGCSVSLQSLQAEHLRTLGSSDLQFRRTVRNNEFAGSLRKSNTTLQGKRTVIHIDRRLDVLKRSDITCDRTRYTVQMNESLRSLVSCPQIIIYMINISQ